MSSLDESAELRKQRLRELRKIRESQTTQEAPDPEEQGELIKHRNYDPEAQAPRMGFIEPPKADVTVETISKDIENETKRKIQEQESIPEEELDLTTLRPKKPTWDLDRDLKERMAVLEPKNQNARAYYIRQTIADREKKKQQQQEHTG
ncbi:complexed with Cdc5 protein Cwf18 [Schizosaccharomyces octosporus yFS286]|uniref:Complexed with Cdc5 protein Cwf18 n=1 Tax=Schizosaccharomyces octosporus (strain yFS286) TaxID=483514 RepID=S9PWP6_SCHOY|nr:complexed with Cdc5 protein Cwf18 [Schizosaccharomyces octosporus yFS286]EPX73496.1 complexed with Cdc5 protein Cwf18 [Schizosaccharomyces octosporus yFS286]